MTALQWITKEAKAIRKKYPKRFATWREYVAQASAIYAKKHHGKSPVGKKKRKVSAIKILEKNETQKSRPKHTYKIVRTRTGRFKKYKQLSGTAKKSSASKKKRSTGRIETKSKSHTDYNRNKVNISVGKTRKRRSAPKKKTVRRRSVGAVKRNNLLPIVAIAGAALIGYALIRKQQTGYQQYPVQYQPTGNQYRDQTATQILSYAQAAGLTLDAITKLIQSINSSSDTQLQQIKDSIDTGSGIPTYYV